MRVVSTHPKIARCACVKTSDACTWCTCCVKWESSFVPQTKETPMLFSMEINKRLKATRGWRRNIEWMGIKSFACRAVSFLVFFVFWFLHLFSIEVCCLVAETFSIKRGKKYYEQWKQEYKFIFSSSFVFRCNGTTIKFTPNLSCSNFDSIEKKFECMFSASLLHAIYMVAAKTRLLKFPHLNKSAACNGNAQVMRTDQKNINGFSKNCSPNAFSAPFSHKTME